MEPPIRLLAILLILSRLRCKHRVSTWDSKQAIFKPSKMSTKKKVQSVFTEVGCRHLWVRLSIVLSNSVYSRLATLAGRAIKHSAKKFRSWWVSSGAQFSQALLEALHARSLSVHLNMPKSNGRPDSSGNLINYTWGWESSTLARRLWWPSTSSLWILPAKILTCFQRLSANSWSLAVLPTLLGFWSGHWRCSRIWLRQRPKVLETHQWIVPATSWKRKESKASSGVFFQVANLFSFETGLRW